MSPAFLYARGARQGSVEGPDMWNQVLDTALREPAGRWESEGLGFMLARDYRKAQKRRPGFIWWSCERRGSGAPSPVLGGWFVRDGRYNESLDPHSWRHDQRYWTFGHEMERESLTIVAGPFTEYKPGDVVEIISNSGRRWIWRVVEGMEALGTWLDNRGCSDASLWHRISKVNSIFCAKKALFCDPKLPVKRRINAFYSTCVPAALHGADEWAHTQSMFQALRIWELGKLRRVLCLRRRPNECWAEKRTGVIVARQLKKHNQPRVQTLAMRRVRIAAWQMVSCPSDAKGRRYCEESVTWRCDEMWRDEHIKLSKEDHRNSTQWKRPLPGWPTYWERPFTRFSGDSWIPRLKACNTWTEWLFLTKEFEYSWHVMLNLKPPESSSFLWSPCGTFKKTTWWQRSLECCIAIRYTSSCGGSGWQQGCYQQDEWGLGSQGRWACCSCAWCGGSICASGRELMRMIGVGTSFVSRTKLRTHMLIGWWTMVILVLERNGWRLISTIKCKKSRHILLSFDGARRESGLGAAAWILWLRDEYGSFEKVSYGGRVLRNASAMTAEREALRMNIWQFCFQLKLARLIFKLNAQIGQYSTNLMRSLCVSSVFTGMWMTRIALVRIVSKTKTKKSSGPVTNCSQNCKDQEELNPMKRERGTSSNKETCASPFSNPPPRASQNTKNHSYEWEEMEGHSFSRIHQMEDTWLLQCLRWLQKCCVIIWPRWKSNWWFVARITMDLHVFTSYSGTLWWYSQNWTIIRLFRTNGREYIFHIGISWNFQSVLGSGMIPGGKENDRARQAVFFTLLNPFGNDPGEEKPHFDYIFLIWYIIKQTNWKRNQDAINWIKLSRAQNRGLRFWQTKSFAIIT